MVEAMGVVIANHPTIVSSMKVVVDVRKVVASHLAFAINPGVTTQTSIATLVGNLVRLIVDFCFRHVLLYHVCCLAADSGLYVPGFNPSLIDSKQQNDQACGPTRTE